MVPPNMFRALILLTIAGFVHASETEWQSNSAEAFDDRWEYLLEAKLHSLNEIPYIAFNLYPIEVHLECKYSDDGESSALATTFKLDRRSFETHILCIQYEGGKDYFYSLMTFDEDIQKHFIKRFATELGHVSIEFDTIKAEIPTKRFNQVYRDKFGTFSQ